jgi:rhomboid family GlyGly-CTERM serine protease
MAAKITQSHASHCDGTAMADNLDDAGPARPRGDRAWLIATFLASVLLALGGESTQLWARYDRTAIAAGQIWRLLSAHWVHLGWSHLVLNLAALGLLRGLMGPLLGATQWAVLFGVAALTIDAGLFVFDPETQWYVGLSGVLHAVAIVVAAELLQRERVLGLALLTGLVGKVSWEQLAGASVWSIAASGGPVIVAAHLYGALAGIACWPVLRWLGSRRGYNRATNGEKDIL